MAKLCKKRNKEQYLKSSKEQKRAYYRSRKGKLRNIYNAAVSRCKYCKRYSYISVSFSMGEFLNFAKTTDFDKLYDQWKDSGYLRRLAPSLDRIDNDKGYDLDNIQIITFEDNYKKDCHKKRGKKNIILKQSVINKVLDIRSRYESGGYTYAKLGRIYNMSSESVSKIIKRITYKDCTESQYMYKY